MPRHAMVMGVGVGVHLFLVVFSEEREGLVGLGSRRRSGVW